MAGSMRRTRQANTEHPFKGVVRVRSPVGPSRTGANMFANVRLVRLSGSSRTWSVRADHPVGVAQLFRLKHIAVRTDLPERSRPCGLRFRSVPPRGGVPGNPNRMGRGAVVGVTERFFPQCALGGCALTRAPGCEPRLTRANPPFSRCAPSSSSVRSGGRGAHRRAVRLSP